MYASWSDWSGGSDGSGLNISSDYTVASRGSLLTVLITETFFDGVESSASYYSYAFDTGTGRSVEYADFLRAFGIDAGQAELYVKEAVMSRAADWSDSDFAPYQTLRGAFTQTFKNYTDAVSAGYLTFYIGEGDVPYVSVMAVTPGGSSEELPYALSESSAEQLLRGEWTLDAGDRVYKLAIPGDGSIALTVSDAAGNAAEAYSGILTAKTKGTVITLTYDMGVDFSGSMKLSGTFINQFIAASLEGASLAPGEYACVETAEVYEDGLMG